MIIRCDCALEITTTRSQPPLPPSQSRRSRAARTSQICATERSSTVSAMPHRPDTVSGCQLKQKAVSAAQTGGNGLLPARRWSRSGAWQRRGSPSWPEGHRAGQADRCRCRKATELESPCRFPAFLPKSQYFN